MPDALVREGEYLRPGPVICFKAKHFRLGIAISKFQNIPYVSGAE